MAASILMLSRFRLRFRFGVPSTASTASCTCSKSITFSAGGRADASTASTRWSRRFRDFSRFAGVSAFRRSDFFLFLWAPDGGAAVAQYSMYSAPVAKAIEAIAVSISLIVAPSITRTDPSLTPRGRSRRRGHSHALHQIERKRVTCETRENLFRYRAVIVCVNQM